MAEALENRVIAIAETRELDVFAALLERRGARVLRYPLVKILDSPDAAPVLEWLHTFAGGGCDELILLTGEGLRRLLRCLDLHEPALRSAFLAALGAVRKITRGPKPARALRELGLRPDVEAQIPTTAGVIAALQPLDLRGHRVGLQLYGGLPNPPLCEFLERAGAQPLRVSPYVYADASADAQVRELLTRLTDRSIDAIAFTSMAQVERLFRVAPEAVVRAALAGTAVAAVGPVVAQALAAHGVQVGAMPESSWFMKPLAVELSELLAAPGPAAGEPD